MSMSGAPAQRHLSHAVTANQSVQRKPSSPLQILNTGGLVCDFFITFQLNLTIYLTLNLTMFNLISLGNTSLFLFIRGFFVRTSFCLFLWLNSKYLLGNFHIRFHMARRKAVAIILFALIALIIFWVRKFPIWNDGCLSHSLCGLWHRLLVFKSHLFIRHVRNGRNR